MSVGATWKNAQFPKYISLEEKPFKPVAYLIGSLRNENIPKVGAALRSPDLEVFDDWFSAGEYADDALRDYYRDRKFPYQDILDSYAAKHIFSFDKYHLDRADYGILVMPAGKSGHLELGYLRGQGKTCYILFDQEPERVDIMHQFANGGVFFDVNKLKEKLYADLRSGQDAGSFGF